MNHYNQVDPFRTLRSLADERPELTPVYLSQDLNPCLDYIPKAYRQDITAALIDEDGIPHYLSESASPWNLTAYYATLLYYTAEDTPPVYICPTCATPWYQDELNHATNYNEDTLTRLISLRECPDCTNLDY